PMRWSKDRSFDRLERLSTSTKGDECARRRKVDRHAKGCVAKMFPEQGRSSLIEHASRSEVRIARPNPLPGCEGMTSGPTTSTPIPATPSLLSAPTQNLRRIGLLPFAALLFAYCTGGPFGFESMISTSGPGLTFIFLLVVPLLFSVPIALAAAEMA